MSRENLFAVGALVVLIAAGSSAAGMAGFRQVHDFNDFEPNKGLNRAGDRGHLDVDEIFIDFDTEDEADARFGINNYDYEFFRRDGITSFDDTGEKGFFAYERTSSDTAIAFRPGRVTLADTSTLTLFKHARIGFRFTINSGISAADYQLSFDLEVDDSSTSNDLEVAAFIDSGNGIQSVPGLSGTFGNGSNFVGKLTSTVSHIDVVPGATIDLVLEVVADKNRFTFDNYAIDNVTLQQIAPIPEPLATLGGGVLLGLLASRRVRFTG
jgi:hypothetical protein